MSLADRMRSTNGGNPRPRGGSDSRSPEQNRVYSAQRRIKIQQGVIERQAYEVDHRNRADRRRNGIAQLGDLEIELKRSRIVAMYLKGKTVPEIAVEFHMSTTAVDEHIMQARERWAAAAVIDVDSLVQQEIAKLDHLEASYWSAWEASQNASQWQHGVHRAERFPVGDPAFLAGVYTCIDRRIKLLGLDAPIKIDITDRIRMMAEKAGFDGDEAVREAERILEEMKLAQA